MHTGKAISSGLPYQRTTTDSRAEVCRTIQGRRDPAQGRHSWRGPNIPTLALAAQIGEGVAHLTAAKKRFREIRENGEAWEREMDTFVSRYGNTSYKVEVVRLPNGYRLQENHHFSGKGGEDDKRSLQVKIC